MQIAYPNPLQVEHEVLIKIRREIESKKKGAKIEITERTQKAEFTVVSARITVEDHQTSICQGQVPSVDPPIINYLKAEIIALIFCCNELGIFFDFEGTPQRSVSASVVAPITLVRLDRKSIMSCSNVPQVLSKMKAAGLDVGAVKDFIEELKRNGHRSSVVKIADRFFPAESDVAYVKSDPPKVEKKDAEPEVAKKEIIRDNSEAMRLHGECLKKGITVEKLADLGFHYNNVMTFCLHATDSQIEAALQ